MHIYLHFKVSKDGVIGFNPETRFIAGKIYSFEREKYSNELEDYPFIAPFLYGGAPLQSLFSTGNKIYGGKIFHQLLSNANGGSRDLQQIDSFINDAFIGVYNFTPSYGLLVTWKNVTDEYQLNIARCDDDTRPCKVGMIGRLKEILTSICCTKLRFPSTCILR